MRDLPAPKSDFIGLEGRVHLATGGEPPLLKAHRDAFERFARDKADGFAGYHAHWDVVAGLREKVAALIGLEARHVAFPGNASEGIDRVIASFDWRPGDNVVAPALDFPSGRFALANLKRRGVELRLVPAAGWALTADALLDACDSGTRLVYLSQVNALTGQHMDIDAVWAALKDGPTALLVDASHALGVVPVRADRCDFLVSACYKFALGVHEGILAWDDRRWPDLKPHGVGWWSAEPDAAAGEEPDGMPDPGAFRLKADARRAEYGNVGHLGAYLLHESLDYLERYGIDAIAAYVRSLGDRLIEGMTALGLEVMTPAAPGARAGNVAFVCPETDPVVSKAAAEDILIWGDNGRIRASAHLFTTAEDIEVFLVRLPAFLS